MMDNGFSSYGYSYSYYPLLLQAVDKGRRYAIWWLGNVSAGSIRMVLMVLTRLMFLLRDVVVLGFNVLYMIVLIPLEVVLCLIYLTAVNLNVDTDRMDTTDDNVADLNTIRRLFWSGKQISLSDNLKHITIPKLLAFENSIIDNDPIVQRWNPNRYHTTQNVQIVNKPPRQDIHDPFEDQDLHVDDDMQQQHHHHHHHQESHRHHNNYKRTSIRSMISNHLYLMLRPTNVESLDKYTHKLALKYSNSKRR